MSDLPNPVPLDAGAAWGSRLAWPYTVAQHPRHHRGHRRAGHAALTAWSDPRWLLPGVEIALAVGLIVANPVRLVRRHPFLRLESFGLVAAVNCAGSAALLIDRLLLSGTAGHDAKPRSCGAAIYATNIVAFGLWYWELDRGGPLSRSHGDRQHTDFLFPQMATADVTTRSRVPGLPLRRTQRDRLLAHGHTAAVAVGEDADAGPVGDRPGDHRAGLSPAR